MNNIINTSVSLGKRQLVDSIWKSAGIEGLGTTFPSTEMILENLPVMTKRDEVYFICNMKRAWEFTFDNVNYPICLSLLREMHKVSTENLVYHEDLGKIRTIPVSIGGTQWRPELPHEGKIIEDIDRIMENPDKIEAALDMFCYVCRTQMFIDGNKRVAQLITNKILMENNKGILSIPYEKLDEFKHKLIEFYETNDNSILKNFLRADCLLLVEKEREAEKGNDSATEPEI